MREACGPDFFLAFDCWMALTPAYALRLIDALRPSNLRWIEECLPPDDYAGYRQLVEQRSHPIMISTGEHEYTRWGFENLLSTGVDMVQPDIHWCGGLTELLKIKAMASAKNRLCVLHASSVYSYHFAIASDATPFSEFLMMAPQADKIVPMFTPLFTNETVPVDGYVTVSDAPGFGVDLNPSLKWNRPFNP
jgi:L-rhamnonate dehydratase